jgi:hypothetical protein
MIVNNIDVNDNTYNGQMIEAGASHVVEPTEKALWLYSSKVKTDIENDKLTIDSLDKKNSLIYLTGAIVPQNLSEYKELKNSIIDKRTKELIDQGFVFDSVLFSTSETSQRNWMALDQFRNDLTFPFAVSTKNDGEYMIADANTTHSFTLTALGTIEYHYASGRALKQQVNEASSESEVDAIVDNR